MKKIMFVEPAVFLHAFAMSLSSPLATQYVYRRIWEETTNYSFAQNSSISECGGNKSSPIYIIQKEVQKKASLFNLQVDLSGLIPGLVVTLVLLSNSDRRGRKHPILLSSLGALATSVWLSVLSYFSLPLYLLIAASFLGALFGNFATFFGGCLAFIVDQCKEEEKKTIRIAIVDLILGLVTGLTGLSSGYFIRELGFTWSFLITAVALACNLIYLFFCLEDPVSPPPTQDASGSCGEGLKKLFSSIHGLFKNASPRRRTLISLLLFTMVTYFTVLIGESPIFILYELNAPLCWNEVFIGYGSALGSISFLSSFIRIWVFSYCLKDSHMACIGILTTIGGMAMAGFATTTLLMFLVRLLFLFAAIPMSVLRAMLSKVVRATEQGTLFACIAFLETLTGATSVSAFNGIYSATVGWFSGFTFLLSAGLLLIPLTSLCVVMCVSWDEGDGTRLLQDEEPEESPRS
ncbi:solute carrier family 46 member 3 [Ornithorhynchus anatinus]|uniref:Lysosomal proton-coupled steroid conjugate and bile acid symporter SLC46A3 n=1 Tax=Ornithorhynchus anatinus TaxID=9258 RepID=F6SNT7_ORNAN|nr:solute carrier family 46 member 3 [Ornithorhynchus anatinus]